MIATLSDVMEYGGKNNPCLSCHIVSIQILTKGGYELRIRFKVN